MKRKGKESGFCDEIQKQMDGKKPARKSKKATDANATDKKPSFWD